jgi:NAD-dependent dihydropyrimidine dehydrogenase PreA subunit
MKTKRKIIRIDEDLCDGCGECVPSCAEGAIQVIDGKARLVADVYCDGLGACLGHCPKGALEIIEREADEFDEEEVEKLLKSKEAVCPSSREQVFGPISCECANQPVSHAVSHTSGSALSHWPVQLNLVSPKAPFLRGADLLIAADCTAFAYAGFHRDFLEGKALLIGCPKFDDQQGYVKRLADIFRETDLRSVTVLVMEVPCCQGMTAIVERALKDAGKEIPFHKAVIGTRGNILSRS